MKIDSFTCPLNTQQENLQLIFFCLVKSSNLFFFLGSTLKLKSFITIIGPNRFYSPKTNQVSMQSKGRVFEFETERGES